MLNCRIVVLCWTLKSRKISHARKKPSALSSSRLGIYFPFIFTFDSYSFETVTCQKNVKCHGFSLGGSNDDLYRFTLCSTTGLG